jgi:hypothetical protein
MSPDPPVTNATLPARFMESPKTGQRQRSSSSFDAASCMVLSLLATSRRRQAPRRLRPHKETEALGEKQASVSHSPPYDSGWS